MREYKINYFFLFDNPVIDSSFLRRIIDSDLDDCTGIYAPEYFIPRLLWLAPMMNNRGGGIQKILFLPLH